MEIKSQRLSMKVCGRLVVALVVAAGLLRGITPTSAAAQTPPSTAAGDRVDVLLLGGEGHHRPAERAGQILPEMARRGIAIQYADDPKVLATDYLSRFDVLLVYANHTHLSSPQERALLNFVSNGGGFVPVHSASACFSNSAAYINLVGGAFKNHGTGVFQTEIIRPEHPAISGLSGFKSWDETYVHHRHNPDKTVLSIRVDEGRREPWTWVRRHGEGRVFYTAWGHDERTWSKEGFHDLLERGIRWAAGDQALDARPSQISLEYEDARIPYYPPGEEWGTTGPPITRMQKPLRPEASMQLMQLPPGFSVELFAAEPDIAAPIAMAWDARGRLWIAETKDYPNELKPGENQGRDRIRILEDTNGDGRADSFTTFADSLSLPTSLVFANGGLIVNTPPRTIFLKDTDGDDRADVRRVLFEGWGTFDTHAGPNSLQYGFDNQIWGTVGYAGFSGTVGGTKNSFSQGIYRFAPDGSELEFLRATTNNTWGLGFSEDGLVFGSTANRNPSVFMPIPNRYYESVEGWSADRLETIASSTVFHPIVDSIRQVDHHGHYTAADGHSLYTARSFPRSYWNRTAFVGGPTGHLLGKFSLKPSGSGFTAENRWNMLASRDTWTAPISADVGPDGALWMIDWYSFIVQHNPIPEGWEEGPGNAYETPLRDRTHGRIYRIVYDEAEHSCCLNLEAAGPGRLVEALRHDNMFWRLTAQRLLVERGRTDVVDDLLALARDDSVDELGLNPGAFHALWTLDGLGLVDREHPRVLETIEDALYHPAAGVRRAALMVLPHTDRFMRAIFRAGLVPTPDSTHMLGSEMMDDPDPEVRLATLLALADMPSSNRAGRAVFTMLLARDNAEDRWIPDAAAAAGAAHAGGFLAAAFESAADTTRGPFPESVDRAVRLVAADAAAGGSKQMIVDHLEQVPEIQPATSAAFLDGLLAGWPSGRIPDFTARERETLLGLRTALPPDQESRLLGLLDQWQIGTGPPQEVDTRTRPSETSTDILAGKSIRIRPVGDQMLYATTEIRAKAGTELTIIFENIATSAAMTHNVVVVEDKEAIEVVGQAALTARETEYIPRDEDDQIVAHTPLAPPGETVRVTFTVPPPGDYPYICTFPGHYRSMQGVLISVE